MTSNNEWNRAKRKRKNIEIVYSPGSPTLTVKKVVGKHLESMGIPAKSGYFLYPEEAVYLMETGSATIYTPSGAAMDLLEAFSILESNSVSMSKYEIYKQVKRTGLVVLRPRRTTIDYERFRQIKERVHQKFAEKTLGLLFEMNSVPEKGVPNPDSYPTYSHDSGQISMQMKVLHRNASLINFLPADVLRDLPTEKILQNLPLPTQRVAKHPRSHYPFADCHVNNWSEYRFKMEKIRQNSIINKSRKFRPPSQAELRRDRITVDNVDFHVFSPASFSHRLPARPLFSLVCHSATDPPLNVWQLSELHNVVFGIEEAGKVNYVALSGGSIDLNDYL